jgi:hypothetical protein
MIAHDRSNLRVFYHTDLKNTTKIVFIHVAERETKITWVITLPARNSFSSLKKEKKRPESRRPWRERRLREKSARRLHRRAPS